MSCDWSRRAVTEVTFAEFVNGGLHDPVLRQVVAPASGKRQRSHVAETHQGGI